jgi:hypothetical protein
MYWALGRLGIVVPGVKRFVLRFWNAASCERASATTGAKARLVLIALRGAEAPLFHVTARAALPRHCMRRSSTSPVRLVVNLGNKKRGLGRPRWFFPL